MKTQCPKCLAVYSVAADASKIGKVVLCKKCGERFAVLPMPTVKPNEAESPPREGESQDEDQLSANIEAFLANLETEHPRRPFPSVETTTRGQRSSDSHPQSIRSRLSRSLGGRRGLLWTCVIAAACLAVIPVFLLVRAWDKQQNRTPQQVAANRPSPVPRELNVHARGGGDERLGSQEESEATVRERVANTAAGVSPETVRVVSQPPSAPGQDQGEQGVAAGEGGAIPARILAHLKSATVFIMVQAGPQESSGSGFLLKRERGVAYVVTNAHVVDLPALAAKSIRCVFHSGTAAEQSVSATVVGLDEDRDLAILKVELDTVPEPVDLDAEVAVRETLPVFILGFPFGDELRTSDRHPAVTISRASISSMRRDDHDRIAVIQIDGDVNPGNSGGPIVDAQGRLIGIAVAKVVGTQIGMAIPADDLSEMLLGRVATARISARTVQDGIADMSADVLLIDPLRKIKSVSLHYLPDTEVKEPLKPDRHGVWPCLPNAQQVVLRLDGPRAAGEFKIPSRGTAGVVYTFQVAYVGGDDKLVYTEPGKFRVDVSRPNLAAGDRGMGGMYPSSPTPSRPSPLEPPPFGPPPFGAQPFGPPPINAQPFGISPFGPPTLNPPPWADPSGASAARQPVVEFSWRPPDVVVITPPAETAVAGRAERDSSGRAYTAVTAEGVTLDLGKNVLQVFACPTGSVVYVIQRGEPLVRVFDPLTWKSVAEILVPESPTSIWADATLIGVACDKSRAVVLIDAADRTVIASSTLPELRGCTPDAVVGRAPDGSVMSLWQQDNGPWMERALVHTTPEGKSRIMIGGEPIYWATWLPDGTGVVAQGNFTFSPSGTFDLVFPQGPRQSRELMSNQLFGPFGGFHTNTGPAFLTDNRKALVFRRGRINPSNWQTSSGYAPNESVDDRRAGENVPWTYLVSPSFDRILGDFPGSAIVELPAQRLFISVGDTADRQPVCYYVSNADGRVVREVRLEWPKNDQQPSPDGRPSFGPPGGFPNFGHGGYSRGAGFAIGERGAVFVPGHELLLVPSAASSLAPNSVPGMGGMGGMGPSPGQYTYAYTSFRCGPVASNLVPAPKSAAPVNDPPSSATVGDDLSYTPSFEPGVTPSAFRLKFALPGMTIEPDTGALVWRPGKEHVGRWPITILATVEGEEVTVIAWTLEVR